MIPTKEILEEKPHPQFNYVHQISHMDCPGVELGPPR
jgi:hypothetical protein